MRAILLWPALDLAKTALGGHRPDGREGLKVKPTNRGWHKNQHTDVRMGLSRLLHAYRNQLKYSVWEVILGPW